MPSVLSPSNASTASICSSSLPGVNGSSNKLFTQRRARRTIVAIKKTFSPRLHLFFKSGFQKFKDRLYNFLCPQRISLYKQDTHQTFKSGRVAIVS